MQRRIDGKRCYVTMLPTLAQARQDFCDAVDDPEWPFPAELDEDAEDPIPHDAGRITADAPVS